MKAFCLLVFCFLVYGQMENDDGNNNDNSKGKGKGKGKIAPGILNKDIEIVIFCYKDVFY